MFCCCREGPRGAVSETVEGERTEATVEQLPASLPKKWQPDGASNGNIQSSPASREAGQKSNVEAAPPTRHATPNNATRSTAWSDLGNNSEDMFEIVLTKTAELNNIGIDIGSVGHSLLILRVHEQGLINDWNQTEAHIQGKPQIKSGFHIMGVNDISHPPIAILEAFLNSLTLKLILKPG
mmetsp:Transcript_53757/g.116170  ORF Transcript_53757/g.116170 Transcript_53757/m.116170 type:complete len:181 (+) Transcript_53757:53-595(+)